MNKVFRIILYIIMTMSLIYSGAFLMDRFAKRNEERAASEAVENLIEDASGTEGEAEGTSDVFSEEAWRRLHEINPDFIGYLFFDDGLIAEPVVQGSDNEYYLNHWIDGSYSDLGTVFIDANNNIEKGVCSDSNMILYGHYAYYDLQARFSPLTQLTDQSEYDLHHSFRVFYEDNCVKYIITHVIVFDSEEDAGFNFRQTVFSDKDEFRVYKEELDRRNTVRPADQLYYGDRMVTLQTCARESEKKRIVVVCREIAGKGC